MRPRRIQSAILCVRAIVVAMVVGACSLGGSYAADPNTQQYAASEGTLAKIKALQERLNSEWESRDVLLKHLEEFKSRSVRGDAIRHIQEELGKRDRSIASLLADLAAAVTGDAQSGTASAEIAVAADASLEQARQLQLRLEDEPREDEQSQSIFTPLPPIIDPQTTVYPLSHVEAKGIANTLTKIFGNDQMRVAIGDDPKTLIVVATRELADDAKELVQLLDVLPRTGDVSVDGTASNAAAGPRSLLVRIFWVADHLPEGEGQELANFLPIGVIEAFENLGLESPRVVTQTVNSVAKPANERSTEPVSFATATQVISPSIAATQFQSKGIATLNSEGRVDLNVEIQLNGGTNCQVAGAITAPLGHYVVLGTANSMVLDPKNAAAGVVAAATGDGMDGGQGRGFEGGGLGFDGGRGYDPGMGGMPFGGTLPPNMRSSRIAFVVQVIENKSYGMDGNE
jgi:hypothetical protein